MASGGDLATGKTVSFGPYLLIGTERLLLKDGEPVAIGGRAFDVLAVLIERAGEVLSVRELVELVWPDIHVEEANLRVHIAGLRKALGEGKDGSRYIVNVAGRGYTFVAPVLRSTIETVTATAVAEADIDAGSVRRGNLPAPPRFLVGRTKTVEMLSSLLLSRRFVSVVGPGGIGKTTVAVTVANMLREEFGEGAICFVDLGSLSDPADVPSAVASALGCFVQGLDSEPYIRAFLDEKQMLIVFDSCEHVVAAVAALAERLFDTVPSLHLLTTSREALRVNGENVHFLTPLDSPPDDTVSAAQALASPAVQLFMERAASSGYHGGLRDADAPVVTQICRRLDGIALAIELVASRVGAYGIQGTASLLDSGAELFLQGRRGASRRHQTLNATLDWSFNLLSPAEQRVLCRLSVFVGPFELPAASAVAAAGDDDTSAVTHAITSLVDKSLIWISRTSEPAYYRLLDTTRAYAAAKFADSENVATAERRHALYFAAFLKAAAVQGSAFDGGNAAAYAPHVGNVRKALAWSCSASGDRSIGVDLAAHAAPMFLEVSLFGECQQWCRSALSALQEGDRGTQRELALQAALAVSSLYAQSSNAEISAAIERGLQLSDTLRIRQYRILLRSALYVFLARRADSRGSTEAARQGSVLAKAGGDTTECAITEWVLCSSHHLAGDHAAAVRHGGQGMKLATEIRPARISFFGRAHHTSGLSTFARSLWLHGFREQGYEAARRGIKTGQGYNQPVSYCIALVYLIPVLHWSGDLKGAAEQTEILLSQCAKYSLLPYHALALGLKGELMLGDDDPSGLEILRSALQTLNTLQFQFLTSPASCAFAEGLARFGQTDEALATIDEIVSRTEQAGEVSWLPDLLRARGEILLAQPQPDFAAAEASLLRAMDGAAEQSALSWELKAAIPLARLWSGQGRADDARVLLQRVYAQFTEGFESGDMRTARQLLDQLAARGRY